MCVCVCVYLCVCVCVCVRARAHACVCVCNIKNRRSKSNHTLRKLQGDNLKTSKYIPNVCSGVQQLLIE